MYTKDIGIQTLSPYHLTFQLDSYYNNTAIRKGTLEKAIDKAYEYCQMMVFHWDNSNTLWNMRFGPHKIILYVQTIQIN